MIRVTVKVKHRGSPPKVFTHVYQEGKDLWENGCPLGLNFLGSEHVEEIEVKELVTYKPKIIPQKPKGGGE